MNTSLKSYPGDTGSGSPAGLPLQEVISLLSGGKSIVLASTVIVFCSVALYNFLSKPIYESTARLVIDFRERGQNQRTIDFTGFTLASKITNEIETLTSNVLAEEVANVLEKKKYLDKAERTIAPILRPLREDRPDSIASIREVTGRLKLAVEFTPVKESDVIKISARSSDPREAVLIANTYTEVYSLRSLSQSRAKSRSVREFLQSQLETKQHLLDSTEASLRNYMQTTGTVALEDKTKNLVEQLARLEATRDALDVDINSRDQTLRSYKSELATQEPNVARAIGESNDTYIHLQQEQLARLEVQRDFVLSQNPTLATQASSSVPLKDVDAQIAALKKNLQLRTKSYLSTLSPSDRLGGGSEGSAAFLAQVKQKIIEQQIELDGLKAKRGALVAVIGDYDQQFNQLPRRNIEMARLQRSRLSIEKLYALIEEKFNEAVITEKSEFGSVTIIDPASVPTEPVSPKIWLNLVIGVFLGFGGGVAIVFIRFTLDIKIRAPQDIKRSGLPVLAVISRMELDGVGNEVEPSRRGGGRTLDLHLVANTHRTSPLVESYRHLFTNFRYIQLDKPLRSLVVTSVKMGEGKSITASNLAIVAAESEKHVLLLDADLRRPTIHSIFGLPKNPGVMDVMLGNSTFETNKHSDVLPCLDVLCSGKTPPNPSAVIGSTKWSTLLAKIMDDYDMVILDSPPLLAVNDPLVLASQVDGIVLVASAGQTTNPELDAAVEALGDMRGKLLGVVLNNFDPRKTYRSRSAAHGYGYGYGYGSGKAFQRER